MNINITMTDKDTGEILYKRNTKLVCQFHKNDTAFKLFDDVVKSAVRGIRYKRVRSVNLVIDLCEPKEELSLEFANVLPFQDLKDVY